MIMENSSHSPRITHVSWGRLEVEVEAEGRSRVTALGPDKIASHWFPRFVVDASGRDALLLKHLGLRKVDKRNNTAAVFGHFRDVSRTDGSAQGMITMHLFKHGWFWTIPLPDDVMSVGLVGTRSFFRTRMGDLDRFFARAVAASPSLAERMTNAELISPLTATANYSYSSPRFSGDGYILIGDAAAFIDPLFSSGVMMAMSSAGFAADIVHVWLDDRKSGERQMQAYERKLRRGLHSLSWLIYRINNPVLRDIFMASFDLFNTRNGLLAILAGDFYEGPRFMPPLRRLQLAYGLLYLFSKLGFRLRDDRLMWQPRPRQ